MYLLFNNDSHRSPSSSHHHHGGNLTCDVIFTQTEKCSSVVSTGRQQKVSRSTSRKEQLRMQLTPSAEGLKAYMEQFGEIGAVTIMRDAPTGRSRGFAFLTYTNPASVTKVMNQVHHLDGKQVSSASRRARLKLTQCLD